MAATPVPERIAFAPPRSPFVSAAACTSNFSTLRMNPKHYGTTTDGYGGFYRSANVAPASRVESGLIRAPMPSAYYLRGRPMTADDYRPSVSTKAPAAFPRLDAGMQGSIMRTPGVMWASKSISLE